MRKLVPWAFGECFRFAIGNGGLFDNIVGIIIRMSNDDIFDYVMEMEVKVKVYFNILIWFFENHPFKKLYI